MKQTQMQKEREKNIAINYVHKNIIHNESIGKERKYETKNLKYEFTFSHHNFYPLSEKPNRVIPTRPFTTIETINKETKREYKIGIDPISNALGNSRISKSIARMTQTPKEKYDVPQTSSHEIGWLSKPLFAQKKWDRPRTSSNITVYGSDYFKSFGINPFKISSSSMKMR